MSSIRRSHRSRGGGGLGVEENIEMGQEDEMNATEDVNGSPIADEGLRRGKRKRNSFDAAGQNGRGDGETNGKASADAGLDGTEPDSSPLRTRSSRKIVVRSVGAGPPMKTARGEEVIESETSNADNAHTGKDNGGSASSMAEDDVTMELKRDYKDTADVAETQSSSNDTFRPEAAKMLHVFVSRYCPELLKLRPQHSSNLHADEHGTDPRKRGAAERRARSTETLEDILYHDPISVQKLRDHLLKIQAPLLTPSALRSHLTGSHIVPSRNGLELEKKRLTSVSTILSVIDEMARRGQIERSGELTSEGSSKHFALNMRLPIGDFFTNSVPLSRSEAMALKLGESRLVDVSSFSQRGRSGVSSSSIDVPSIGSRLRRAVDNRPLVRPSPITTSYVPRREEDGEPARPVSHLYYNPWSSFAPTYDSFDGQLGFSASTAVWRSKREEHATSSLRSRAKPSVHGLGARQKFKNALASAGICSSADWDLDVLLAGYDALPDSSLAEVSKDATDVDSILHRNALLLAWLQDLQEQRWMQLLAKHKLNHGGPPPELAEPDENERGIASYLYDSLVKTLSVQPRSGDGEGHTELLPSHDVIRALARSSAIDPSLSDHKAIQGLWGSLDEHLYGPTASKRITTSRSAPPIRPTAAIRDDETCRLPVEQEDKMSVYLANSAQTAHSVRAREKGSLDSFAHSRAYSLSDHPHDRKPPVPPQPTVTGVRPTVPAGSSSTNNTSASPYGLRTQSHAAQGSVSPMRPMSRDQSFNRLGSFGQHRPTAGGAFPQRHNSGQTVSYARPQVAGSLTSRYAPGNVPKWNANQSMGSVRRHP